jgi:hypothetical protein
MSLFLYLSVDAGMTLLREARLPFRVLEHLHDPFVSNHALKAEVARQSTSQQEIEVEIRRQFQALPDHLAGLVTLEYFREQMLAQRETVEASILARQQRPDVEMLAAPQRQALTVLRLFETPTNPVLWEYVGDHYRGMVVELDVQEPTLTAPLYQDKPQILRPVQYTDERPVKGGTDKFPSLFHRPKAFAAENEWRLLRPRTVADKTIERDGETLFLHPVAPRVIRRLVFGCNVEADQRTRVTKLLKHDLRYRHLLLQECCMDPYRYDVLLQDIERT